MKKSFTYLLASLLCLCGCKENDHIDYTLNDRVYFYETEQFLAVTNIVREMNYSFSLKPSSLMQSPLHYEILDGIIPKGHYDGYLPVLLKRTADTKDHSVTLYLQIIDNEEFTTGNPDAIHFRLSWADMLMQPAHWPYYFGKYSTNKYRFAIDVLGLTDWPQATRFDNGSQPGVYTAAQLQLFASQLNEAYQEYRKTHDPIYVDDNAEEKEEIYYAPNT